MQSTRVWLWLALGCMGVAARYLPTPELIADSLVPFSTSADASRPERSVEGSGAGGVDADMLPIQPMPMELSAIMERLEAAPDAHNGPDLDEGSGAESVFTGSMFKAIDDPIEHTFAKEPGMHDVYEDLNKPVGLPTEDDNRQSNSLNVLPSDQRPENRLDEEDRQNLLDEGSGQPDLDVFDARNVSIVNFDDETSIKGVAEAETVTALPDSATSNEESVTETIVQMPEAIDSNEAETTMPTAEVPNDITETESNKDSAKENIMQVPGGIDEPEPKMSEPAELPKDITEIIYGVTTSEPQKTSIEVLEPTAGDKDDTEGTKPEVTSPTPLIETKVTTDHVFHSSPDVDQNGDIPVSAMPGKIDEEQKVDMQSTPSYKEKQEESTAYIHPTTPADTSASPTSDVEIIADPKLVHTSAKEASVLETKLAEPELNEASGLNNLSTAVVIGALFILFVSLVILVVVRNRRKRLRLQEELNIEGDTGKGLLTNGKYKPDAEDVKNNEISPLVLNKFEKSPNFSSKKNLNTTANNKHIEKDNVLKQAFIEDEVEEAKKAIEEENEESKREVEEPRGRTDDLEKVVVRTHIDPDSIPKKALIVTKNGNTYQSVPSEET